MGVLQTFKHVVSKKWDQDAALWSGEKVMQSINTKGPMYVVSLYDPRWC